jgi:hypothetical protein
MLKSEVFFCITVFFVGLIHVYKEVSLSNLSLVEIVSLSTCSEEPSSRTATLRLGSYLDET